MGSTNWNDDDYADRAAARAKSGTPTFAHHAAVTSGKAASALHDKMNPLNVKLRESRDSAAHPTSKGLIIGLDVTGSMSEVPKMIQKKLPELMGLLIRKGYLEHPAIMISAIGDATSDQVPLQVGQFESGIEIEQDLEKLYLEGNGGGQNTESYELAMYFYARHTALDCLEKRKERGYRFLIGDEHPYPFVKKAEIERIIGGKVQSDIPVKEIVAELEKMYDTYFIIPNMTSHYREPDLHKKWTSLFGPNVLRLEHPDGICELIAATVGAAEGKIDVENVEDDLKEAGVDGTIARSVKNALVPVGAARGKSSNLAVPDSGAGSGLATL